MGALGARIFEKSVGSDALVKKDNVFLDQFIASFDPPPRHLTFDLDGKPRVALTHRNGWSGCWLKDRGDAIRAGMALDAGGGRLVVQDETERPFLSLP
jgi:hypothetical protein